MYRPNLWSAGRWPLRLLLAGTLLLGVVSCHEDAGVGPDPEIAFLVGEWEARSFVVRDPEFPVLSVDLVQDLGGRFQLFVEPSGRYTALLATTLPQPPESGALFLEDDRLVLDPDDGEPAANEFELIGWRVILRGESQFAFSGSAGPVPVEVVIDLEPAG